MRALFRDKRGSEVFAEVAEIGESTNLLKEKGHRDDVKERVKIVDLIEILLLHLATSETHLAVSIF